MPPTVRRPLYEIVWSVLAERIASGALPRGLVIREKAVGEAFGLGRMPVAQALTRLEADGLVHRRPKMHGVVVGQDADAALQDGEPLAARLGLPREIKAKLQVRNWRQVIYPGVEREVASCLMFGRFQIRSQALAEHFGVSRTVANELLLRLERVGLVRQEANARWYAGPLTPERMADLYEMRILLEPPALRQSAASLSEKLLRPRLKHVLDAVGPDAWEDATLLYRLEVELHQDIILRCTNAELRNTLYRCQLPLVTAHLSFDSYEHGMEVPEMIEEHRAVFQCLAARDVVGAAAMLERHLQRSRSNNPQRLSHLRPIDPARLSPYLDPA